MSKIVTWANETVIGRVDGVSADVGVHTDGAFKVTWVPYGGPDGGVSGVADNMDEAKAMVEADNETEEGVPRYDADPAFCSAGCAQWRQKVRTKMRTPLIDLVAGRIRVDDLGDPPKIVVRAIVQRCLEELPEAVKDADAFRIDLTTLADHNMWEVCEACGFAMRLDSEETSSCVEDGVYFCGPCTKHMEPGAKPVGGRSLRNAEGERVFAGDPVGERVFAGDPVDLDSSCGD